jgi:hypothetical protein
MHKGDCTAQDGIRRSFPHGSETRHRVFAARCSHARSLKGCRALAVIARLVIPMTVRVLGFLASQPLAKGSSTRGPSSKSRTAQVPLNEEIFGIAHLLSILAFGLLDEPQLDHTGRQVWWTLVLKVWQIHAAIRPPSLRSRLRTP